jgi:RNase P subunit RPR2
MTAIAPDVARTRRRNERLRTRVFDHYGWTCQCCGSSTRPSIDHADGNGKSHREAIGIGRSAAQMYHWLVTNGFPDGFQTLCVPCNKSKGNQEHCILNHEAGSAAGMTSAERARRWRENHAVRHTWGTCPDCGRRHRLRKDGTLQAHRSCMGGVPPFAALIAGDTP